MAGARDNKLSRTAGCLRRHNKISNNAASQGLTDAKKNEKGPEHRVSDNRTHRRTRNSLGQSMPEAESGRACARWRPVQPLLHTQRGLFAGARLAHDVAVSVGARNVGLRAHAAARMAECAAGPVRTFCQIPRPGRVLQRVFQQVACRAGRKNSKILAGANMTAKRRAFNAGPSLKAALFCAWKGIPTICSPAWTPRTALRSILPSSRESNLSGACPKKRTVLLFYPKYRS